jgi:hypothetical protein
MLSEEEKCAVLAMVMMRVYDNERECLKGKATMECVGLLYSSTKILLGKLPGNLQLSEADQDKTNKDAAAINTVVVEKLDTLAKELMGKLDKQLEKFKVVADAVSPPATDEEAFLKAMVAKKTHSSKFVDIQSSFDELFAAKDKFLMLIARPAYFEKAPTWVGAIGESMRCCTYVKATLFAYAFVAILRNPATNDENQGAEFRAELPAMIQSVKAEFQDLSWPCHAVPHIVPQSPQAS